MSDEPQSKKDYIKEQNVILEALAKKRLQVGNLDDMTSMIPQGLAPREAPGPEASLPHNPERIAALGLTVTLPPAGTSTEDTHFQHFLQEATAPHFHIRYPTYQGMAKAFGVSVSTIKTWLLSQEFHNAIPEATRRLARSKMPSILDSVATRAELLGDPKAAKFVAEQAGMDLDEKAEALRGIESKLGSIRDLAFRRQQEAKRLKEQNAITVEAEDVG